MPNNLYNLFLDDIRVPTGVKMALHNGQWEKFPSHYTWVVVRSYGKFVTHITENGLPERIAFDHDLASEHYPAGVLSLKPIEYNSYTEKTGYDCAKWLVDYCEKKVLPLPEFYVHSFNPVGRMNIANYLIQYQRLVLMASSMDSEIN